MTEKYGGRILRIWSHTRLVLRNRKRWHRIGFWKDRIPVSLHSATTRLLPPAHSDGIAMVAGLVSKRMTIRKRDLNAVQQSLPFRIQCALPVHNVMQGLRVKITDFRKCLSAFVTPCRVNCPDSSKIEKEGERGEPFQPIPPFIGVRLGDLNLGLHMLRDLVGSVRPKPSAASIRRGVGQRIELVIAHDRQGIPGIDHLTNDLKRFTNLRTPIDVVAEKKGFAATLMKIRSEFPFIPHGSQEIL